MIIEAPRNSAAKDSPCRRLLCAAWRHWAGRVGPGRGQLKATGKGLGLWKQGNAIYTQFPIQPGITAQMSVAASLWHGVQEIQYISSREVICRNSDPIGHPPSPSGNKWNCLSRESGLIEVRISRTDEAEALIKGASQPRRWGKELKQDGSPSALHTIAPSDESNSCLNGPTYAQPRSKWQNISISFPGMWGIIIGT